MKTEFKLLDAIVDSFTCDVYDASAAHPPKNGEYPVYYEGEWAFASFRAGQWVMSTIMGVRCILPSFWTYPLPKIGQC